MAAESPVPHRTHVRATFFKEPTCHLAESVERYRRSLSRHVGGTALMDETGNGGGVPYTCRTRHEEALDKGTEKAPLCRALGE
jgi:hypothetical protein